ncbi:hypothetical protein IFM89_011519 [Coptis chinensis]|uniref:ABC transporter domain-containing protein n=1 Tax=Coptis chinensis TaxID=261450 RepID=A0A835MI12_9MAGN|nr:hypothetical protein IFM89_011519 [Coptis chinensis]
MAQLKDVLYVKLSLSLFTVKMTWSCHFENSTQLRLSCEIVVLFTEVLNVYIFFFLSFGVVDRLEGEVTYNGHKLNKFVPQKTSVYVGENDLHIPLMSVKETLDFSARCQGVGEKYDLLTDLARREKAAGIFPEEEVDIHGGHCNRRSKKQPSNRLYSKAVVREQILGLDICKDTIIGDQMRRGISGGQRKRVTTGEMIVGPTKTLFMDEISTGLDTSTTYQIVKVQERRSLSFSKAVASGAQKGRVRLISCKRSRQGMIKSNTGEKSKPYRYISANDFSNQFKTFLVGLQLSGNLLIPYDNSKSHKAALVFTKHSVPIMDLIKANFYKEVFQAIFVDDFVPANGCWVLLVHRDQNICEVICKCRRYDSIWGYSCSPLSYSTMLSLSTNFLLLGGWTKSGPGDRREPNRRNQRPENLGQTEELLDPCLLVTVSGNGQRSADIEEQIADLASSNAENTKVVARTIYCLIISQYGDMEDMVKLEFWLVSQCSSKFLFVFAINRFNFQKRYCSQLPTQVVVQTITENVTAVPNSPLAESVPIVCVGPSTVRTEESGQSSGAQGNGTVVEELNASGHDTGADPSIGLQLALYVPAEITTPIVNRIEKNQMTGLAIAVASMKSGECVLLHVGWCCYEVV